MAEPISRVRRVVMSERAPMMSAFERVEDVVALVAGRRWEVWGWDRTPELPTPSPDYRVRSSFPPPGGVRVTALTIGAPSGAPTRAELEAVARLTAAEPAGLTVASAETGMHRTDTIDIGIVVSGSVLVEASDGTVEELRPGDVYFQYGAAHTWRPGPDAPAHVVFVVIGAERPDERGHPS